MMNNSQFNRAIQARGANLLGQMLKQHPRTRTPSARSITRALTRKPTDQEMSKAVGYVHKVGKREEAFEDLLWALINSTEFQTKR